LLDAIETSDAFLVPLVCSGRATAVDGGEQLCVCVCVCVCKNISPIDSAKNQLVRSRLDFGCQHHTSGAVNELLPVPSLAPGKMPNALAHASV
jgi:hypothetical protein